MIAFTSCAKLLLKAVLSVAVANSSVTGIIPLIWAGSCTYWLRPACAAQSGISSSSDLLRVAHPISCSGFAYLLLLWILFTLFGEISPYLVLFFICFK